MNKTESIILKVLLKPLIGRLLIKKVSGLENLPKGNFILAANHQSNLDHFIAGFSVCMPRSFKFIGQVDGHKGLNKLLVDLFYGFCGTIPLDRNDGESKKTAIKKAVEALKNGYIVGIYPEGTRTRNGELGEAKPGVAKIFLGSGAPIVPVAIKGTFELFPPRGKLKIKRIVEVKVGRPIYFKKEFKAAQNLSYQSEKYKKLCQEISDKVMANISDLRKE